MIFKLATVLPYHFLLDTPLLRSSSRLIASHCYYTLLKWLTRTSACVSTCQMRETKVTFHSSEGHRLAGILTEPQTPNPAANCQQTKPFAPQHCAVLCHGFASHKQGFHFPAIAEHLASKLGLSSLRFDYAGNMDSSGDFKFGGFMKEVEQMAAAKSFLEQQHNKQVVMLLGHSRGAINATLYSGKYGDIPLVVLATGRYDLTLNMTQRYGSGHSRGAINATLYSGECGDIPLVVLVAGRYDLTLNMTQRYGPDVLQQLQQTGPWSQTSKRDGDGAEIHWSLTAEEMQERFALDMAGACAAISNHQPQPSVLVIHGASDSICQESDARLLAQSIAGAQFVSISGANHWFKGRQQQLLKTVEDFVVKAWQSRAEAAAAAD